MSCLCVGSVTHALCRVREKYDTDLMQVVISAIVVLLCDCTLIAAAFFKSLLMLHRLNASLSALALLR